MDFQHYIKKKEKKKAGSFTFGKALVFLVALLMLTSFAWADTNGVWHEAEDVRGTVFGADEGFPDYIFNSTVNFKKDLKYKGAELDALYINTGETGDSLQDNTVDNSEIQNTGSFTFGGITSNGNLDMKGNNINNIGKIGDVDSTNKIGNLNADMVDGNNWADIQSYIDSNDDYLPDDSATGDINMNSNNIDQAKNIYANVFYDRDNTGYAVEPAAGSNMNILRLYGKLNMNGNNINNIGKIGNVDSTDNVGNLNADKVDGQDWNNIKNYVDNKVAGISDTDAATHCSGNNVFLDGNGNCRDITNNYGSPIHGDLIQSNTVDGGEIQEGSLDCSQITGGGGLCDGNDDVGATESYVDGKLGTYTVSKTNSKVYCDSGDIRTGCACADPSGSGENNEADCAPVSPNGCRESKDEGDPKVWAICLDVN